MNTRVSKKDAESGGTIGIYGEDTKSNNRLLYFCLIKDLIISIKFFKHIREVVSRKKDITDYIIINKNIEEKGRFILGPLLSNVQN